MSVKGFSGQKSTSMFLPQSCPRLPIATASCHFCWRYCALPFASIQTFTINTLCFASCGCIPFVHIAPSRNCILSLLLAILLRATVCLYSNVCYKYPLLRFLWLYTLALTVRIERPTCYPVTLCPFTCVSPTVGLSLFPLTIDFVTKLQYIILILK